MWFRPSLDLDLWWEDHHSPNLDSRKNMDIWNARASIDEFWHLIFCVWLCIMFSKLGMKWRDGDAPSAKSCQEGIAPSILDTGTTWFHKRYICHLWVVYVLSKLSCNEDSLIKIYTWKSGLPLQFSSMALKN
jgi:hypothetical protein